MNEWATVIVVLFLIPVVALWAYAIIDLLRRTDQRAWRKVAWLVGIVLLPIVGPLLYLIIRPSRRGDIRGFGATPASNSRADHLVNGGDSDEQ